MGSSEKDAEGSFVNDLLIPRDSGIGARHCLIKYLKESQTYALRDLGDGSGTFIKLVNTLVSHRSLLRSLSKGTSSLSATLTCSSTFTWSLPTSNSQS